MRIVCLVFVVIIFIVATTSLTSSGVPQKRRDTKSAPQNNQILYDLNGIWVTDKGEEVELVCPSCPVPGQSVLSPLGSPPITHSTVTAKFTGGGGCKFGGQRQYFIDGNLTGKKMTGQMMRCTESEALFKDCSVASVYPTDFRANLISKDEIYGYFRSEWWGPGGSAPCKYHRDKSGDHDVAFGLTRKQPTAGNTKHNPHCPETNELKTYKNVSTRAKKMIDFVNHFARAEKTKDILEQSSGTLEKISDGLETIIDAGEKCEEVVDFLNDVKEFQAAMDQINNAGCNTHQLATGFDQLFRSAGNIGNRINYFPQLKPLFKILSQNQDFFSKVSGALDPEHRWADPFSSVEGYIPNCPK